MASANPRIRRASIPLVVLPVLAFTLAASGGDRETANTGDWVDGSMKELGDGLLDAAGKIDLAPDDVYEESCRDIGDWADHANNSPFPDADALADGWQAVIDASASTYAACRDDDVDGVLAGLDQIQDWLSDMAAIVKTL